MRQARRNQYADPGEGDHFLLSVVTAAMWIGVFIAITARGI